MPGKAPYVINYDAGKLDIRLLIRPLPKYQGSGLLLRFRIYVVVTWKS